MADAFTPDLLARTDDICDVVILVADSESILNWCWYTHPATERLVRRSRCHPSRPTLVDHTTRVSPRPWIFAVRVTTILGRS